MTLPNHNQVEMVQVISTNIAEIGYVEAEAKLYVRFKGSDWLYCYDPLPEIVWLGLRECTSKGRYLQSQIIPFFRCRRVKE